MAPIQLEQRTAAKVAGVLYLLQMASGVFGFWAKGQVIAGDAARTAANLEASERLYRLGIASDLVTCVVVLALTVALYAILRPAGQYLALFAAFLRVAENSIGAVATLNGFLALRLLGRAEYLGAIETEPLQSLARLFMGMQGQGLGVAFVFLGLGSAVFSVLWFRSRYIPRGLAAWGVFASLVLAGSTLAIMVFPGLASVLTMAYMAPMGIYEVGLGLWLLVKGIRATEA